MSNTLSQKSIKELCELYEQAYQKESQGKLDRQKIGNTIIRYANDFIDSQTRTLHLHNLTVQRMETYRAKPINKQLIGRKLVKTFTDAGIAINIKPPHPVDRTAACQKLLQDIGYQEETIVTTYIKYTPNKKTNNK